MATTKTDKPKQGLRMNDNQKQKYAELFIGALATMESAEWSKPWVAPHQGRPANLEYRKPFKGSNRFFLSMLCAMKGWKTPLFITFDQADEMGLQLNMVYDKDGCPELNDKGLPVFERPFPVLKRLYNIYHDGVKIKPKDYDELDEEEKKKCHWRPYDKFFYEFNIEQTNFAEVYPDKWKSLTEMPAHDYEQGAKDEVLEKIIMENEWRCDIRFEGYQAYYAPGDDHISLPERSQFLGDEKFYGTALHEMAHSTAPDVKRDLGGMFGTESYAMEEFVAELTSASVCSILGIGKLLDSNHLAYVASWRKALKDDKDFIPKVIDSVQTATNYILKHYEKVQKDMEEPLSIAA